MPKLARLKRQGKPERLLNQAYSIFEERLGIYFSSERSLATDAIRKGDFSGFAKSRQPKRLVRWKFFGLFD
jgi:hypothetical protein